MKLHTTLASLNLIKKISVKSESYLLADGRFRTNVTIPQLSQIIKFIKKDSLYKSGQNKMRAYNMYISNEQYFQADNVILYL